MQAKQPREARPVESIDQLIEYFRAGGKPASKWRLGTEHEMVGVSLTDPGAPISYEGPSGIEAVLDALAGSGWTPVREGKHVVALSRGDESVTLEPGGQLELSAQPVLRSEQAEIDLCRFVSELGVLSRRLGIAWLATGFRPFGTLDDVPWMPKARYGIMREYLPTRGRLAHEMMKRTATVQVNIDYADEADAAAKLRAALSVTSILTALYANSPIVDGAIAGYQSYRAACWLETDPDRCGLLELAFEDGDIFERYARWALGVPMFFVNRDGYRSASGMTFAQFMTHGFEGHRANMDDWALHLSTLFPEARLKQYIEVRSCDSGSLPMVLALGPLCRGLLYDADACAEATALTAGLDFEARQRLQAEVPRTGLAARAGNVSVGELARELVAIADAGLRRSAPQERHYLDPVREIAESGRTQADVFVDKWKRTGGDPVSLIPELSHPSAC